jgi:hypothetical protein
MWKIRDVQLIDPNAADYFTELYSMQRKEGGEIEMAKKQDAFKHLHEHLILELVYFDRSNMIMYFGWCNHEEVKSNISYNMHTRLPEYQRYWLLIKTKWGKICITIKCRKLCYQQQSRSQSECQFQPVEVLAVT